MTIEEARATLRRVFLLYDGDSAWLNEDRQAAQEWADSGKLALEYGLVARIRGANDILVPIHKEP